jgi:arylsulfatase A-like enzyme
VLTGDHGEMLGEHREYGHAKSVFEAAMRVPLVFAGFGAAPPAIAPSQALASQLDIAPTLLQFTGMPVPHSWAGLPLQRPLPPRQLAFQQGHFVGLYDSTEPGPTLKYWRHLTTGDERVYDIAADPGESRNQVSTLEAGRLERLRAAAQPIANAVAR